MRFPLIARIKHALLPLRHITELPLAEMPDRKALAPDFGRCIPPIVYQTWEDRRFGKTHRTELAKFRELNPELSFEIWDKEKRDSYLKSTWGDHPISRIYERSLFGPMKADIFRYCLMAERGGFYFDISKAVAVPLRELYAPKSDGLVTFEPHMARETCSVTAARRLAFPENRVLQWGFGFAPGHPFPRRTIENICAAYAEIKGGEFARPKEAILQFTGPEMFTRSVRQVLSERDMPDTVQAGIDFHGQGIFALRGSEVRYITSPSYSKARNSIIVE